jgi:hypothetical protein
MLRRPAASPSAPSAEGRHQAQMNQLEATAKKMAGWVEG